MEYKILKLANFKVQGISTKLTKYQSENSEICKRLWRVFNKKLKYNKMQQSNSWCKYGFTYKKNNEYYYYCAVPDNKFISNEFEVKEIKESYYLVFEHRGRVDDIKDTINSIYKEFLKQNKFKLYNEEFFHFERYDYRFNWNKTGSVIEIYVPIMESII